MKRVLLIHWKESELPERAERLERLGYGVDAFGDPRGGGKLKRYMAKPPDAFVIDLSRLPSHGRAVGVSFRGHKPTRHVPLVFVGGEAEKLARIREQLPDATYTTWSKIAAALKKAMGKPVKNPVVPRTMDAYSRTPLPKKLGVKAGTTVLLLGAPEGFEDSLSLNGDVSRGGSADAPIIKRQSRAAAELVMLFVRSQAELQKKLLAAKRVMADGGSMWIAWPKKASGLQTDVSEPVVRAVGLSSGLVDFKICAIDNTWSGLRFCRRKTSSKNA